MPLRSFNHRQILISALLLGFVLRGLSAWYAWGPQALDDYLDAIVPAWKFSMGMDTGLHDYRSPLFIWILAGWLKFGSLFGITKALSQVRWICFFLATSSLTAIFGVDLLTSEEEENSLTKTLPLFLMAAYGLIPFISTRAFLESFSLGFLTLGIALLESARNKKKISFLWGFAVLGFATLIRFQLGVLYVAYLMALFFLKNRPAVLRGLIVGVVLLFAEAMIDQLFGRPAFATLKAYFLANAHPEDYGLMPWYTTWITWLAFSFFPFSLLFWRSIPLVWQKYKMLCCLTLLFVLEHSLAPHKEERFLYPILGLTFVLWGTAWAYSIRSKWVKRIYLPVFVVLNTALLSVGCLLNTQVGEVGAPAEIEMRSDAVLYLDFNSLVGQGWMWQLFVRTPGVLRKVTEPLSQEKITSMIEQEGGKFSFDGVAILTADPESSEKLSLLSGKKWGEYQCESIRESTSIIDHLIYQMNPSHNQRRRPEWYLTCWRDKSPYGL